MMNRLLTVLCLLAWALFPVQAQHENLKMCFDIENVSGTSVTDNISGVTAKTVVRNRDVQLIYQNQGGRKTLVTFHLSCEGGNQSSIESVSGQIADGQSSDVRYFDLQGRLLNTSPARGIYIKEGRKHTVK